MEGGHWTRDIQFSPDGKKMFVSVGSESNVDDTDTTPAEKNRADILQFNPDGSDMRVYASGIRNAVGLAINPITATNFGVPSTSATARVTQSCSRPTPTYSMSRTGAFTAGPGGTSRRPSGSATQRQASRIERQDHHPRCSFATPQCFSRDALLRSALQFPAEYRGDIFSSQHMAPWNRSVRAGYEVIRVPMHTRASKASGEYEGFHHRLCGRQRPRLGTPCRHHRGGRWLPPRNR